MQEWKGKEIKSYTKSVLVSLKSTYFDFLKIYLKDNMIGWERCSGFVQINTIGWNTHKRKTR